MKRWFRTGLATQEEKVDFLRGKYVSANWVCRAYALLKRIERY